MRPSYLFVVAALRTVKAKLQPKQPPHKKKGQGTLIHRVLSVDNAKSLR
jgi:hypothetical protein